MRGVIYGPGAAGGYNQRVFIPEYKWLATFKSSGDASMSDESKATITLTKKSITVTVVKGDEQMVVSRDRPENGQTLATVLEKLSGDIESFLNN